MSGTAHFKAPSVDHGGTGRPQKQQSSAPKQQGPRPVQDAEVAALKRLIMLESEARRATSVSELVFMIANETRKLINARQIFVVRLTDAGKVRVEGISSLTGVDRNSPAVLWVEELTSRLKHEVSLAKSHTFRLPAYCRDTDTFDYKSYPFPEMLWVPLAGRDGSVLGGLLLAREVPWGESDKAVSLRISEGYSYCWLALEPPKRFDFKTLFSLKMKIAAAALALLVMLFPVKMSILAPAEIAAQNSFVIAAPMDGTIEDVLVNPNTNVSAGTPLIKFSDTQARNALLVSEREVEVAEAKLKQVTQAAFIDPEAKRELASARADLAVKQAERDYARDMLAKTVIAAPRDGIAVFSDKRDIVGRPANVGQRILEIADPQQVFVRIEVPVQDAIALEPGARVRVFLDTDPLRPLEAVLTRSSHTAHVREANVLAFRLDAELVMDDDMAPPRLGLRGTAQVQGDRVSLFYYLFRRPISYLRQRFGL